jgi:hypothetical protein
MRTVLVGFCLALMFILLDGYDQLYARSAMPGYLATIQGAELPHVRVSMPTEHGTHSIEAEAIEEQDDQFNTFRKFLQTRCQLAIIVFTPTLKVLLDNNGQSLAFNGSPPHTHLQHSPVLLQVFRI